MLVQRKAGIYSRRRIFSREHLETLFVLSSSLHEVIDPLLEDLLCHARFRSAHRIIWTGVGAEKAAGAMGEWLDPTSVPTKDGVHPRQRQIGGHHLGNPHLDPKQICRQLGDGV